MRQKLLKYFAYQGATEKYINGLSLKNKILDKFFWRQVVKMKEKKLASMIKYIDDRRYGLVSIPLHKTKKSADQRADRYRKAGYDARVIKIDVGKYAVYSRRK